MSEPRLRRSTRAIVLDEQDRILLVRFGSEARALWVTPGGGVEEWETEEDSIRRELHEETGLVTFELGPHVWTRTAPVPLGGGRWDGEVERIYLVRTESFDPVPGLGWDRLRAEGVLELRWWAPSELEASEALFAPRRLPSLLLELLARGVPGEPLEVGL